MASDGVGQRGAKRPAQGEEGEDTPLIRSRLLEALRENREEMISKASTGE